MAILAKVGFYGDIHLSSKNYGAHRNYPKESLEYFTAIADITEKHGITHLIGTGDFTFGRFNTLEYRGSVDNILNRISDCTNNRHYMLCGNHDKASYGLVERDYYIEKGLLKPSENLSLGKLNITMVDYGKYKEVEPNITLDNSYLNLVVAHDFFKFKNTSIANFGKSFELDSFEKWFGVDFLVCGHIHKIIDFEGEVYKGDDKHKMKVSYLGCMTRPAYREGYLDDIGRVLIITVYDDGKISVEYETVTLWEIKDSFNLEVKQKEKKVKEEKQNRIDISDIVQQLNSHERNVGNPEDIINAMVGVEEKYKDKAIKLLKEAQG